jgi:hypothetical protein
MNNKEKYGEVETPEYLVKEIFSLLEPLLSSYKQINAYEVGYGQGTFYRNYNLKEITNYTGCEINETYELPKNIARGDFYEQELNTYDLMMGNLPFNSGGLLNVPCKHQKKGTTVWKNMLRRCVKHIRDDGYGAFIIPCMWLKPDKENIYDLICQYQIQYLKIYNATDSNKIFKYQCQTPICYVIFKKTMTINSCFNLYDKDKFIYFNLYRPLCIPTQNGDILQKCIRFIKDRPHISVLTPIKVACMKKTIVDSGNDEDSFAITTSILKDGELEIKGFHSVIPGAYHGVEKIILSHKRLPIPIYDQEGQYGIYGRDKYVFTGDKLVQVYTFLQTELVQKLIKSFGVRMNFYEKYIFDYVPDPRTFGPGDYETFFSLDSVSVF